MNDKDREAYERGQIQKEWDEDLSPPGILWSLFGPEQDSGSSSSESSAFDKGRDGEQLDDDKGNSGGCFLTKACVEYAGLADDCHELRMLRRFRDDYVSRLPKGEGMLIEYYACAPRIARAINSSPKRNLVLSALYSVVQRAVEQIERGDYASAVITYSDMFRKLQTRFPNA